MNIAIVTDSTCDLSPAAEVVYQIDIVPLLVSFSGKVYQDGIDMTNEAFYSALTKASTLPTTSQPAPATFQALFQKRLDEGKTIIGLFISSTLSGTYQTALLAKNGFSDEEQRRIFLIDSRNGSGSLALLVLEACALRDQGCSPEEICKQIDGVIPRVRLYAALDTLRYLRMGGRISAAAAAMGGLLNIVPVITLDDGVISVAVKIRKSKDAFRKWLRDRINNDLPDPRFPVFYLHTGNLPFVAALQEEFKYLFSPEKTFRLSIGAVVGTHAGPGALGMVYVTRGDGL